MEETDLVLRLGSTLVLWICKCLQYFTNEPRLNGRLRNGGKIINLCCGKERANHPVDGVEKDHEPCQDSCKARTSFDASSSSSSSSFSCSSSRPLLQTLDASSLGDIPTQYVVPTLKPYEMPVVGLYIDPRVVCGFRYRVRRIDDKSYLFGKQAVELQSIGRGYSRRLTFAGGKGRLNHNENYFWSDSFPSGFAFELEVISPGEKFTIHDSSNLAVGFLEILNCTKPQEEVGQTVKKNGTIEKTVRVHLLCKVEWFDENGPTPVIPVTGLAICSRCRGSAEVTKVVSVNIGSHARRGFTLTPGIGSHKRSTTVKGALVGDVPTVYTVLGLEPYELPVVGTYVDTRIMPGFLYRVRPTGLSRRHLFEGKALRLQSIGAGYGKRLTFAPSPNCLNTNDNFFWSDSYADGLGFEPRAVEAGAKFVISTWDGLKLGKASVFRADAPQYQEREEIEKHSNETIIRKFIHVDVKCHVTLNANGMETKQKDGEEEGDGENVHTMRVNGTAMLEKSSRNSAAILKSIENIGLDSQLNVLFVIQHAHLVFHPA
ncbi:uncharacterized protein LOC111060377 isoform X2 [Nilaparvata lugens]|uniref:uncharacterized protein LOC111060377 isoform X2 n=1 Tax=Nilaparvata lugens TaxID=108931 RepID=UPI00193D5AF8|nr:uncharacterized protein LOC111060377 isoform X2 [Nilaparvata lugens]XP_039296764.1 uncharacterized protein LOC111060377 isoform X2 [Nilaparvata lugens]